MRTVFADTWYFLALVNANDAGHSRTVAFTKSWNGQIVSSSWVLTEFADALAGTSRGRAEFLSTLNDLRADPDFTVVPTDDQLWERGRSLYEQRQDKQWSLTDCISFVIMRERGLLEALTADHHFEQAGFVALLK
jgi:uncharacterized protein